MNYDLLNAINPSKDEWSIRVRICRIWESRNWNNDNNLISLDMILMDQKGNLVHATIRKTQITKYKHLLQEGCLYEVKNFKVVSSNGPYKPVMGKYRIFFQIDTAVQRKKEGVFEVPRYGFQFVDMATLESRINKKEILSDVMGCLSVIGGIVTVGVNRKKRELHIITQENVHAKIALWGSVAENFNSTPYEQNEGPFIFVATSTTVKKFQGELSFSITPATKVYVNPDMPEVHSMIERFSRLQTGVQIFASEPEVPVQDQMFQNRMTLKELLEKDWQNCPSPAKEYYITVRATITDIGSKIGWYYLGCFVCTKKVDVAERTYFCSNCNQEGKYPLPLYKIQLKVSDGTASSAFMLFNREAEKLLDSTVTKILHEQDENDESEQVNSVPFHLLKLCGKTFIFRLKLNKHNINEGRENYSVSRVYDVDENLEHEYQDQKIKKPLEGEDTVYVQRNSSREKFDTTLDQAKYIEHHKCPASTWKGMKNALDLEEGDSPTSEGKGMKNVHDLEGEKSPTSAGQMKRKVHDINEKVDVALDQVKKGMTRAEKGRRKIHDFNQNVDVALDEVKKRPTSARKGKTKIHDLEMEKTQASARKGKRKIDGVKEEKKHSKSTEPKSASKRRKRVED